MGGMTRAFKKNGGNERKWSDEGEDWKDGGRRIDWKEKHRD